MIEQLYIIDSFIYLISCRYSKSCIYKMVRPESVLYMTKKISGLMKMVMQTIFKKNFKLQMIMQLKNG